MSQQSEKARHGDEVLPPTAAAVDSADLGGGRRGRRDERDGARVQAVFVADDGPALTTGNVVLLVIGILLLPIWLIITFFAAIGPIIEFLGRAFVAVISSAFLLIAAVAGTSDWKNQRKRLAVLWLEVRTDWIRAGRALVNALHRMVSPWGLGRLVARMRRRIDELQSRYDELKARDSDPLHTPEDFREQYHVVDQLPSGGSSAKLYVVRRAGGNPSELFVLKHFDMSTGNLENVVRENQAVELARRLNLIVDSQLGSRSFYYVMPYYRGDTMTARVLKEVGPLLERDAPGGEYQRLALGWVHQLLQLIAQYHDAGVIHKDIKPDNLIVNGEYLYLVDIGLMTPIESGQQITTHGTEYFRDPELVKYALQGRQVRDVDATKFDLYAAGAVLYFLFEGSFPGDGSLSRFTRDVPRAVQMVVSRAMAPISRRYDDARQMLADLDYLCWAASKGTLPAVRPADLPSFRGSVDAEPSAVPLASAFAPVGAAAAPMPAVYPPASVQRQRPDSGPFSTAAYAAEKRGMSQPAFIITIVAIVGGLCIAALGIIFSGPDSGPVAEAREDDTGLRPQPRDEFEARLEELEDELKEKGDASLVDCGAYSGQPAELSKKFWSSLPLFRNLRGSVLPAPNWRAPMVLVLNDGTPAAESAAKRLDDELRRLSNSDFRVARLDVLPGHDLRKVVNQKTLSGSAAAMLGEYRQFISKLRNSALDDAPPPPILIIVRHDGTASVVYPRLTMTLKITMPEVPVAPAATDAKTATGG